MGWEGRVRALERVFISKDRAKKMVEKAKGMSPSEREYYAENIRWYLKGYTEPPEPKMPCRREDSLRVIDEIKRMEYGAKKA